jgi:hypothetical protein
MAFMAAMRRAKVWVIGIRSESVFEENGHPFRVCPGRQALLYLPLSRDDIVKNVKFEQYSDVRNYYRMNLFVSSYYHFLTKGRPENAYP